MANEKAKNISQTFSHTCLHCSPISAFLHLAHKLIITLILSIDTMQKKKLFLSEMSNRNIILSEYIQFN